MLRIAQVAAVSIGAVALAAGPALAVSVSNQTDKAVEVTADLGANEPKTNVEAGKTAKIDCPEGCEIRAPGLNSYGVSAKSGDKLVIKDGMLGFEGSVAAADAGGKEGKGKAKTMVD